MFVVWHTHRPSIRDKCNDDKPHTTREVLFHILHTMLTICIAHPELIYIKYKAMGYRVNEQWTLNSKPKLGEYKPSSIQTQNALILNSSSAITESRNYIHHPTHMKYTIRKVYSIIEIQNTYVDRIPLSSGR